MKTAREYEAEFLATIAEKTGKNLETWLDMIQTSSLNKQQTILKWLKAEHGLNHSQANMLAGIFLNDGQPVYGDPVAMMNALFEGKEGQRPLYDLLEDQLQGRIPDLQVEPTKGYVSFRADREFACAAITRNEIRLGLDLGDQPFGDYVQKVKGMPTMPRITHMIELRQPADVNDNLLAYLQQAHQRVQ
jgi:predicted transport protein